MHLSLPVVPLAPPAIAGPFSYYLGAHETAALVALVASVEPETMIEFGCHIGRTARRVMDNVPSIATYIGVDAPYGFAPALACQNSEVPFHAGHEAASYGGRFWLFECPNGSADLCADDLEPIDAAFIDGDHSFAGVTRDSMLARALLRPRGVIVWHDYGNPGVEVTAALERLAGEGWPIAHVAGTWLAFMREGYA